MNRTDQRRSRYFPNVDTVADALSECYGDHSHGNKMKALAANDKRYWT
jgi:hypothetical protein